jgi:hypothetical protein
MTDQRPIVIVIVRERLRLRGVSSGGEKGGGAMSWPDLSAL